MKYQGLLCIIVFGLIFTMTITQVSAVHSQGLEWGFEENQRYEFQESVQSTTDGESSTLIERYIMEAAAHPVLDDPVTNESLILRANFRVYWPNNTLAEGAVLLGRGLAVPIGNWSLITNFYKQYFARGNYTLEITDTAQEWGFHYLLYNNTAYSATYKMTYSKQDGVLLQIVQRHESILNGYTLTYMLSRLAINPETLSIILSGTALTVIVVALILVTRIRKSKI